MDKVRVFKANLERKLKENLAQHSKIYLEAQIGYRESYIKELEKQLVLAREGKRFKNSIHISPPVDHSKEYKTAIQMLEMCLDKEIEITKEQFTNFVMDDWSWKANFLTSNAPYSEICSGMLVAEEMEGMKGWK